MLKKVAIIVMAFFVILLAAAAIISVFFKEEIDAKLKTTINNNVNAKVDFKDFDLSLITSFPIWI